MDLLEKSRSPGPAGNHGSGDETRLDRSPSRGELFTGLDFSLISGDWVQQLSLHRLRPIVSIPFQCPGGENHANAESRPVHVSCCRRNRALGSPKTQDDSITEAGRERWSHDIRRGDRRRELWT